MQGLAESAECWREDARREEAMFVSMYRRQDHQVAEMLASTFRSYRRIYTEHGKDILETKIRQSDGLIFVPCPGSSRDLCYRYPNELKDFVFTAGLAAKPYFFQAQGDSTYPDFLLTMHLTQQGPLVTDPAHLWGRAKTVAQWFVDQGATKGFGI
jgi:hypothetical protein